MERKNRRRRITFELVFLTAIKQVTLVFFFLIKNLGWWEATGESDRMSKVVRIQLSHQSDEEVQEKFDFLAMITKCRL